MSKTSIFLPDKGKWCGYQNIKTSEHLKIQKEELEQMWSVYEPHADKMFRKELQESKDKFNQRIWELYLGYRLLKSNHKLVESKNKSECGPDICILENNARIWVENICPGAGTEKRNSIPELEFNNIISSEEDAPEARIAGWTSDEVETQSKLRYLSAIKDKRDKIKKYVDKKVIKDTEAVVIGINSANNTYEPLEANIPTMIRLCYGLGKDRINIPLNGQEEFWDYTTEYFIKKFNKDGSISEIPSAVFLKDEYKNISAIIFSYYSIERYSINNKNCCELYLAHNPFSSVHLHKGLFKFPVTEFWLDDIHYDDEKSEIQKAVLHSKHYS